MKSFILISALIFMVIIPAYFPTPSMGQITTPRLPVILNVPVPYPTIQVAIDAAMAGDTVLVAEGIYYENINFKGKAITVASHFLMNGDTSHISRTVIDGSQPSHPDSGSVVYFTAGGDTTSVLCGFTITGGTGTLHGSNSRSGGGIACRNSGARIIHNIIENNHVLSNTPATPGGGISGGPQYDNSWIVIQDNIIRNNSVTNSAVAGGAYGGGLSLTQNARVINNIIEHNKAYSHDGYAMGGGASLLCYQPRERIITGNKIWHNQALAPTGTDYDGGLGGGLSVGDFPKAEIRLNDIRYNAIEGNVGLNIVSWGGGVILVNQTDETIFTQNYVADNYVLNNSLCDGVGMTLWNYDIPGGPNIVNNIIANNTGGTRGGGIFTGGEVYNNAILLNNTIYNNSAIEGGAIYAGLNAAHPSHPIIINSILWDNSSSIFVNTGSSATVYYSDVQGGFTGYANIDSDPFLYDSVLVSGDTMFCCLAAHSPCIDAGNPDSSSNDIADPLRPGYALRPAMGTIRNDMGRYGGHGQTDILLGVKNKTAGEQISRTFQLYQNFPNPFNPSTKIEFQIPKSEFVTLKIYNLLGEEICTLLSHQLTTGVYDLVFSASDLPSGVYLYRLRAGDFVETRKMLLIR